MRRGRLLGGGQGGTSPQTKLRASRAQERAVAKDVGGHLQVGSGNRWNMKGDVIAEVQAVECKMTIHESYSLKLSEWKKIKYEAIGMNKRPLMAIDIQGNRFAVISWDDFLDLIDK